MSIFSLSFLKETIKTLIKRFPVAMLACVLIFAISFLEINTRASDPLLKSLSLNFNYLFDTTILPLIMLVFLSISAQLLCDTKKLPSSYGALFCFVIFILSTVLLNQISQVLLISAAFLSIGLAPYLSKDITFKQIWTFNHRFWTHITFSLVASIILYLGLAAIIATLNILFKFPYTPYATTWVIVGALFGPFLAMSGIPQNVRDEAIDEAKFVTQSRFLFQWVILPLLYAYAAIIYAYALFILINTELPNGTIVKSVTGFGIVGIATYLAIYPFDKSAKIITLFKKYFAPVSILPLFLLALAISIRIANYGLTEQRLIVVAGIIWGSVSVYFMVKNKDHVIRNIIASLVIILFAITLSPLNLSYLSALSQKSRLAHILEKHNILTDGVITPTNEDLSVDDRIQITNITKYLIRSEKKSYIQDWFKNMPKAEIHTRVRRYGSHTQIVKDMGVKPANKYNHSKRYTSSETKQTFNYNRPNKNIVNIDGYDYSLRKYMYAKRRYESSLFKKNDLVINHRLNDDTLQISIKHTGETYTIPHTALLHNFDFDKARINEANDTVITYRDEKDKSRIKLVVDSVSGTFDRENKDLSLTKLEITLLIDFK